MAEGLLDPQGPQGDSDPRSQCSYLQRAHLCPPGIHLAKARVISGKGKDPNLGHLQAIHLQPSCQDKVRGACLGGQPRRGLEEGRGGQGSWLGLHVNPDAPFNFSFSSRK